MLASLQKSKHYFTKKQVLLQQKFVKLLRFFSDQNFNSNFSQNGDFTVPQTLS